MVATVSFDNSQALYHEPKNYRVTVTSGPIGRRSAGMVEENAETPSEAKKKWSIGKLFRRKKKETDSEGSSASSDENSQNLKIKRKKTTKQKRPSTTRSNDHVNIKVQSKRSQSVTKLPQKEYHDEGVLSDPSAGFIGYVGRGIPRSPIDPYRYRGQDSLEKRGAGSSCGSQDGSLRKGRKGGIKARAEAKRLFRNDSSSDDESQKSNSSSIIKFRSDNSLTNHSKEGSVNKRSRSARNDRYIKRLSRDDEGPLNVEPFQKAVSKSEAEVLALKRRVLSTPQMHNNYGQIYKEPDYSEPSKVGMPYEAKKSLSGSQLSGYVNISNNRYDEKVYNKRQPPLSGSNSSVYSYPAGVINFNAQVNDENISYCIPYNNNNNRQQKLDSFPNRPNFRRSTSVEHNEREYTPSYENNVMVVKLPLGVPKRENVAPPPPPRDPQRKVSTPLSYMYDNVRPLSGSYDIPNQRIPRQTHVTNSQNNIYENGIPNIKHVNGLSWSKRPISSSEDHIAVQQSYNNSVPNLNQSFHNQRPSSVSGEMRPDIYNRYINRPPINQIVPPQKHPDEITINPEFVYFADKTPRSRRPIHIAPTSGEKEQIYANEVRSTVSQPKNASDFWRKLDNQEVQRRKLGHNRTLSDQSIVGNRDSQKISHPVQVPIRTQNASVQTRLMNGNVGNNLRPSNDIRTNGVSKNISLTRKTNNDPICYSNIDIIPMDDVRGKSRSSEDSSSKRKSTNLEDALSELEAIYNSLGLGDEDLLDRAERQESLASKALESNNNYFAYSNNRDSSSDFQKRLSLEEKKILHPDKVHDDMAYRRLNPHERPKSKDVNNLVSQVSYMLASPMHSDSIIIGNKNIKDEPDIVYDDVAYRNIKQANNYLKIDDPQPPFGIPIGPISPAPNSDYLHVIPESKTRSRYIPQESPDIVADDLAFRALRKDCKTVSPINREITGSIHNNNSDNTNISRPSKIFDNHVTKKKRAIRSLSANIFTLIQKEIDDALNMCNDQGLEKSQSIPDLPEAVIEYGKRGTLKENLKQTKSVDAPRIVDTWVKNKQSVENNINEISNVKLNNELRNKFFNSPTMDIEEKHPIFNNYLLGIEDIRNKDNISSVQDDLDLMAEEAKETSAKLVIALEELQKDRQKEIKKKEDAEKKSPKKSINEIYNESKSAETIVGKETTSPQKMIMNKLQNENQKDIPKKLDLSGHILSSPSNIKLKGTIPAHIKEKMEEFSKLKPDTNIPLNIDSIDKGYLNFIEPKDTVRSKGKRTEDSLIAISNQLNIVGSTLKTNSEPKCDILVEEGQKLKELAEKCAVTLKNDECVVNSDNKSNKEPSYESFKLNKNDCLSPESKKTYMNEIDNLNNFDDLRKGISDLLDGIGSISSKLNLPNESQNDSVNIANQQIIMDINKEAVSAISFNDSCSNVKEERKDSRESPEYNSSEELAMIFHLNEEQSKPSTSKQDLRKISDSHVELSSPRLVKNANQSLRKMSLDEGIKKKESEDSKQQSQIMTAQLPASNEVPWRKFRRSSMADNVNKGNVLNLGDHRSGVRRRSHEITQFPHHSNSSAFHPVKPRRFVTETPCAKSKVLKEKPFFEDIRIIARGFGEIIEYPNRRGCVEKNDDRRCSKRSPIEEEGHSKRVRLSQDLTKAAQRKGGTWKARRNIERNATIDSASREIENENSTTQNVVKELNNEIFASDLKLPQLSNATVYSKSESVINLGSFNTDILTKYSDNKFTPVRSVDSDDSSFESDYDCFELEYINMSSGIVGDDIGRAERMRKYKEERRKQIALQSQKYGSTVKQRGHSRRKSAPLTAESLPPENGPTEQKTSTGSASIPVVRTTRASRLRAAATVSADQLVAPKRNEKKSSEGRSTASRPNSSSSAEATTISPMNANDPCVSASVLTSLSSDILVQNNETNRSETGGVSECVKNSAVINTCDKISGKANSLEEAAMGKEITRQPAVNCQKGNTPRQFSKPSSSSPIKDSSSDEISSRRGRTASSRQGNITDSDYAKESMKCAPLSVHSPSSNIVTRQTPPRSSSSPRSSSHSPQSPSNLKLQYKGRSVDLNSKLSVTNSHPADINPSSKPFSNALSNVNTRKSENKSSSSERRARNKDSNLGSRQVDSKNEEQNRLNKRLISNNVDSRTHTNNANKSKVSTLEESNKVNEKMSPGIEKNLSFNFFPSVNLDKNLTNMSSIVNPPSKLDKIRANNNRLSSRMDALAALTKETLARVDRLSKMTQDSVNDKPKSEDAVTNCASNDSQTRVSRNNKKSSALPSCSTTVLPSKQVSDRLNDIDKVTEHLLDFERRNALGLFSKQGSGAKKTNDSSFNQLSYTPVSILKRKSSQEEHGTNLASGSISTPPVTFSPSVVDPIPSKSRGRGLGILKKRRSLDESHVHRRRSCSPEVAFADDYNLDSRPILKTQRRSSLEELIRGRSPDGHIHGILKRKPSRDSEPLSEDRSLGSPEPQGILKRKSNSSSSSSTASSHVSIAQAVILAAAGGAEIVDDKDSVKPILKKKSISEDRQSFDSSSDGPRPILKKKSLTESDDNDHEKPKKPILKSSRKISLEDGNTSSFDLSEDDRGSRRSSVLKHRTPESSECESSVRPILKHASRDHSQSPRPRLSFCSDDERAPDESFGQHFINPSFSILRRLETNNSRTSDEDDEASRPSKFESGRLQSPSKLKDLFDCDNNSNHANNALRRREDKPKVVGRSKSLAPNEGDELDVILKSRRFQLDEENLSQASASHSSAGNETETPVENKSNAPKFPSIAERIECMQKYMGVNSQGAIPKKRSAIGRYKTQPITVEELQNISSLELCQADFQRLTGQSSSSSTGTTDTTSTTINSQQNNSSNSKTNEEAKTATGGHHSSSPDPFSSWDNFKFKNYAASPNYNRSDNVNIKPRDSHEARSLFTDQSKSPVRVKPFERVTASAGSPEYRPHHPSPDFQQSSDNSEISSHSSGRRQIGDIIQATSTPERNITSSESAELDSSFSENFVPSPQCYKFKRQFSDELHKIERDSLPGSRRNSGVKSSNDHLDKISSIKDSPTTSEFSRIFKETARHNYTNFDSLDFSNLNQNSTVDSNNLNLPSNIEDNIVLVDSFADLITSTVDNKADETSAPPKNCKIERPKSLFDKEGVHQKGSREAARQELDKLEVELEDVRTALEADSSALGGVDNDLWSLNVSIDSGVFNRMSSGDSGPLSAEELSLPQDFSKKPDIVRDHQPPSLLCDKLVSPPIDSINNKFAIDDKELQDKTLTPVHIHKQPKMDLEYLQNKNSVINASIENPDEEKCDDPVDSPEQLFGLMKSNSVSARASMWQQLHQQANKAAVKPVLRHSRSRAKDGCPSVLDRFKTQPITMGEVNDASNNDFIPLNQSKSSFNLTSEQDDDAKLDENDPAKLTLAEKMKLFGSTVNHRPPIGAMKKPRSPRFQTMPVSANDVNDALAINKLKQELNDTMDVHSPKNKIIKLSLPGNEEVPSDGILKRNVLTASASVDVVPKKENSPKMNRLGEDVNDKRDLGANNFRQAQNKLAEQASKMLTTEVKGILKSKSGAVPLLPTGGDKGPQLMPLPVESIQTDDVVGPTKIPFSNGRYKEAPRSLISKGGSSEGLKDEGINSSSDDESASHSSHSSDDSCSSSDSSDEFPIETRKKGSQEHLVRPSQLKTCRTESDVARVLQENVKNDRGVKLPCMDEMKARKIMERCMVKTNKENASKSQTDLVKKPPMENKVEQNYEANVKLKNLRNGNFLLSQSLDSAKMSESSIPKNGNFPMIRKNEDSNAHNNNIPPFMRKYVNPVSKSQSMHMFHSQFAKNQKNGREDKHGSGDGSGSDGDSSGGREVRRIINKRRQYRAPQSSQEAVKPREEPEQRQIASGAFFGGLRRSATQPMSAQTAPHRGSTIAERLAALQQSGNNDWRRRIDSLKLSPEDQVPNVIAKNKFNESLSKQAEEKKKVAQIDPIDLGGEADINKIRSKLENSSQDWRKRVGQHDASLFTVAGRMALESPISNVPPSSPLAPALTAVEDKRTPQPNKFRSRRAELGNAINSGLMKSLSTAAVSQPASPKKPGVGDFKRSISVSGVDEMATGNEQGEENAMTKSEDGTRNGTKAGSSVAIPRPDDETFTSFFTSPLQIPNNNNDIHQPVEDIDLDAIDSASRQMLGRTAVPRVRATRKIISSSNNHLKVRATRIDIKEEYTEPITTGVAEMEAIRLKKDKVAQNSSMAVEALAGLASNEDFTAVNLKKTASSSVLGGNGAERSSSKPLLIHVKGRRKVQVRLIEPIAECVNSGDCFVLVTTSQVFCYNGLFSNVIERTRASDISLHIHNKKDLGCVNSMNVITLDEQHKHRTPKYWKQFWALLGVDDDVEDYTPTPAGSVDEDEIYESEITSTNMCYEVMDDVFVPIKNFWGQTPKISMLDPAKILIFDFGSELYVWNGKNTILENRRRAFQLAQELWDTGYNYNDCLINPLNIANGLGGRTEFKEMAKTDAKRPDWAMIAKVTQHMETVLFKDKFLDWPDFTRVIKVKEEEETFKGAAEIKSCNVDVMWNREYEDPSLVLEGSHVGRGTQHYDKETMRYFEVKTKSLTKWMIQEYDYVKIPTENLNEFYSGDTYIIRWEYQITVTGRELNGKPSKHNVTGRDRCAYFYWQGKDASANEKGAAALLTIELDLEKGPQVRVTQSSEPPAFLNMFNGHLVIHQGKKGAEKSKCRLYSVRGNVENESHLVQMPCSMRQLRSRASLVIVDVENGHVYVWHGCKSLKHTRAIALEAATKLAARKHPDLFDSAISDIEVSEMNEGEEPKAVIDILGGNKKELYDSLLNKNVDDCEAATSRLFHFTDLSSQFEAIEILSPLRHESLVTPYPFSQNELYSASQPALFLLDGGDRVWLWQGWWPQQEETESSDAYTGSHRWQVCRRAAMETVLEYWKISRPGKAKPEAYMAIAGLEPLAFTNMFDDWHNRDDVAAINIAQGYGVGVEETSVADQLYQLSCTSFPLAVLRQRPLPESVDPAQIEKYLSDVDFQETFIMTKEEFNELPAWKQANFKKDLGLF